MNPILALLLVLNQVDLVALQFELVQKYQIIDVGVFIESLGTIVNDPDTPEPIREMVNQQMPILRRLATLGVIKYGVLDE